MVTWSAVTHGTASWSMMKGPPHARRAVSTRLLEEVRGPGEDRPQQVAPGDPASRHGQTRG
ncbi:hypothetical protein ACFPRL_30970 [Pseudoclavibacter helvolus]